MTASPRAVSRFPDAPAQIIRLPVERRGYPVPWFVPWVNGEPEFRAVDPRSIAEAHVKKLCWICGKRLQPFALRAFTIGPMCAVNRVSSEPPAHLDCARFAVAACPFLTRPMAKRRPMGDLPHANPAGIMLERNPGATAIWKTLTYRTERQPEGGILFRLGSPLSVEWYAEGRQATRAEIMASIESGLPALMEIAALQGPEAEALLEVQLVRGLKLVPMPKPPPTPENAALLADMVGLIVDRLPEGVTATVILCAGDEDGFEVAVAGSTAPVLLRLVLRQALMRLDMRLAHE